MKITHKIIFGIWLVTASAASGAINVVPGEFTANNANTADNAPLGAISDQQHFQQVFSVSLLHGLSIGDMITGIGFRVEGNESALPAQTIGNYDIGLGQSAHSPGNLSATFANNRGADFLTVRSGSLTVNAGDFAGGSAVNGFGWISFSTPYQYLGGDLLVEIAYSGFSLGRNADAQYPYDSNLAQTAFGNTYNSTVADEGFYNEALVIGFLTVS